VTLFPRNVIHNNKMFQDTLRTYVFFLFNHVLNKFNLEVFFNLFRNS